MRYSVIQALFLVTLYLGVFQTGFTQAPERLSGTWVLDNNSALRSNKSNTNIYQHYYVTLSFDGDKLSVTKDYAIAGTNVKYTLILFTDNRGEKNIVPDLRDQKKEITSKTRWKNDAIVREYSSQSALGFPNTTALNMNLIEETKEKYSLSDDGKNLFLTVIVTGNTYNNGMQAKTVGNLNSSSKLVFRR